MTSRSWAPMAACCSRRCPERRNGCSPPAQRIEIVVTIATRSGARYSRRDLGYGAGMSTGAGSDLTTIETRRPQAAPLLPAFSEKW